MARHRSIEKARPFWGDGLSPVGIGEVILENPNKVLTYVSGGDETVFINIQYDPKVRTAMEQRISSLTGEDVILTCPLGFKNEDKALEYREFIRYFLLQAEFDIQDLVASYFDAIWWGWRPLHFAWAPEELDGSTKWFIRSAAGYGPQNFKFTSHRRMVVCDNGNFNIVEKDDLQWAWPSWGNLGDPHGNALFSSVFIIALMKAGFLEQWKRAGNMSLGVPKIGRDNTNNPGAAGGRDQDPKVAIQQLATEARTIIDLLQREQIILQLDGWVVDMISDKAATAGLQAAMEYCDNLIIYLIAGQSMISMGDGGERGSRAAMQSLDSLRRMTAKSDSRWVRGRIRRDLIIRQLKYNYPDIDLRDVPHVYFMSDITNDPTLLKLASEMGIKISRRWTAHRLGVVVADPDELREIEEEEEQAREEAMAEAERLEPSRTAPSGPPGAPRAPTERQRGRERGRPANPAKEDRETA